MTEGELTVASDRDHWTRLVECDGRRERYVALEVAVEEVQVDSSEEPWD